MRDLRIWARRGGIALMAGLLGQSALAAPSANPERAPALRKLTDCRQVADNAARLACYDAVAAEIDSAQAAGDIVVVDRDQARAVRKQAFGFSLPSLSLFDREGKSEPLEAVTLKVESAARGGDGKWVLRLEGGQIWRQIDTTELSRLPKAGATVTIRSAMLGSYKLTVSGSNVAIRVRREN